MKIRNIAIIAHVDHGKTTLLDRILEQTNTLSKKDKGERVMDSNDLEKEKGITIKAKNTSVVYQKNRINIIDTPGHADFGGEVERVLSTTDSSLLLVDAFEGPMPQTRFVLEKTIKLGHKPILVINKIDRENARPDEVIDMTFDLFNDLGANDEQMDFSIIYSSAKQGWAVYDLKEQPQNLDPLLDLIIEKVPTVPSLDNEMLQYQVTSLDYDDYVGRIAVGKIYQGKMSQGMNVTCASLKNQTETDHKITKLYRFEGLQKTEIQQANSGDIIACAGIPNIFIGDTVCYPKQVKKMPPIQIEEPTVSMLLMINDSPFTGREGKFVTTRNIKERLERELETNVALQLEETDSRECFKLSGRGELHLSVLLEMMRREGFELQVSSLQVILKKNEKGQKLEPFEELLIDVPEEYSGAVISELNRRKGNLTSMKTQNSGMTRIEYMIPTRGLIGFKSYFTTESRGRGVLNSRFSEYQSYKGNFSSRRNGVLISMDSGKSTAYALWKIQERGEILIQPGQDVYPGMIIGIHNRENDLEVNPVKEKKLTNVRASGSDESIRLIPPKKLSLEQNVEFLEQDELLEITPNSLRLRKKELNATLRKRSKN